MKLTIEESCAEQPLKASIEVPKDDLKVRDVVELAYRLLLAKGFTEESIRRYIDVEKVLSELIKDHDS